MRIVLVPNFVDVISCIVKPGDGRVAAPSLDIVRAFFYKLRVPLLDALGDLPEVFVELGALLVGEEHFLVQLHTAAEEVQASQLVNDLLRI